MRLRTKALSVGLFLLAAPALFAQDSTTEQYTVWLGGHYTDFTDYRKKVGEYILDEENVWPEFTINYLSKSKDGTFVLDGHFYDDKNIRGKVSTVVGERLNGTFEYRSLIHQLGQDNLANMETREWLGTAPGGKILTHELFDKGADYNIHRQEILSNLAVLLSRRNNVRLMFAHRTILENGTEQALANSHCFSCHVTSKTAKVDQQTHEVQAGVQADVKEVTVGYQFDYRHFESQAPEPYNHYDRAVNPGNGTSGPEFASRLVFSDTSLPSSTTPTIEKMAHKVRAKADIGKSRLAGSITYHRTENQNVDLVADGWTGAVNYAVLLSPRTRLRAKVAGMRLWNDDVAIDLPIFRAGRPGTPTEYYRSNFDYIRLSTLDRRNIEGYAELSHRLASRLTLSVLAGYDQVKRYHYPTDKELRTTNQYAGQFKLRYRQGLRFSGWLKYRYEKTDDPFTSGRGLFEAPGYGTLFPAVINPTFIFYYQREGLRYQNITTLPTDEHRFELRTSFNPKPEYTLNIGVRGSYDKNTELDSLDVNHFAIQPNLNITYVPGAKVSFSAGYTYSYKKSRGPVAVALFDG